MANTRTSLKSYMGFTIVKINGYLYVGNNGTVRLESNDLKRLKAKIKEYDLAQAV